MTDLKTKSAIVCDRGQFLPIAVRLARDFGQVYYYLMEEHPYPKKMFDDIGQGYPGIKVIDDLWKTLGKIKKGDDIVCFTDVYNGGLPRQLRDEGHAVYSAFDAELLETNRKLLKQMLAAAKLPVIPTEYVKGLSAAQDFLKDKKNKYIKTSYYRGDFETEHYLNAFLSRQWFEHRKKEMGQSGDDIELMIEDGIDAVVEVGMDTPMLNGDVPQWGMVGYELKDKAYIGMVVREMPKVLMDTHKKMVPLFKKAGYQAWCSNEMRIVKDGTVYYSDATCRCGSPPSEVYCEQYQTFSQNVYDLAHGKMPQMKPAARFGVQLVFTSQFNEDGMLALQFPKEIERWVKLKNARKVDDGFVCVPYENGGYFGSVVAIGNDLKRTIATCITRAKMVKGEDVYFHKHSLDELMETIDEGRKVGIAWPSSQ